MGDYIVMLFRSSDVSGSITDLCWNFACKYRLVAVDTVNNSRYKACMYSKVDADVGTNNT